VIEVGSGPQRGDFALTLLAQGDRVTLVTVTISVMGSFAVVVANDYGAFFKSATNSDSHAIS
jgi:hypothetical protein